MLSDLILFPMSAGRMLLINFFIILRGNEIIKKILDSHMNMIKVNINCNSILFKSAYLFRKNTCTFVLSLLVQIEKYLEFENTL